MMRSLAQIVALVQRRRGSAVVSVRGAPQGAGGAQALREAKLGLSKWDRDYYEFQRGMLRHLQYPPYNLDVGWDNPMALGCGMFGCVYALNDYPGWVIKVTGDATDAAAWKAALERRRRSTSGYWPAALARVLTVFAFPDRTRPQGGQRSRRMKPRDARLYGIVMERLVPLSQMWRYSQVDPTLAWLQKQGVTLWDLGSADNVMADPQTGRPKITDMGVSQAPRVEIPELHEIDLRAILDAGTTGSRAVRARRQVYQQPGGWSRQGQPAQVQGGHFADPVVAQLAARAQALDWEDPANIGRFLGKGNFGVVFALDDDTIVKFPAKTNIHGQPWQPETIKALLLHEAGISNELAAAGLRIVPWTVYVELSDGTPALVRERGVEVERPTLADLREVEAGMSAAEALGYLVRDQLLVLRRPDGSLFVGDVGIWKAPHVGNPPGFLSSDSDLDFRLKRWAEEHGLSLPKGYLTQVELQRRRARLQDAYADAPQRSERWYEAIVQRLERQIAAAQHARTQVGW